MRVWFRQLGLVLKKNLTLRTRTPILFGLELFWALLVFLAVVILRQVTYLEKAHTCHFAPTALPSAGVLPFLQSFVCDTGASCSNQSVDYPLYKGAGISKFAARFEPLIQDKKATRVLRDLPYTVGLLDSFRNGLADPNIRDLLEKNVTLRTFLKNPDGLKQFLVVERQILSAQIVDVLLNSTFNLSQIFHMDSNSDFREIVCNPENLAKYLILPKGYLNETSLVLCSIDPAELDAIGEKIEQSLDTPKLIRMSAQLTSLLGDYDTKNALEDVASMLEITEKLNSLQNVTELFPILANFSNSLPDLWKILATAQSNDIDLSLIDSVLRDAESLLGNMDKPGWESLKEMVEYGKQLLSWLRYNYDKTQEVAVTFSDTFGDAKKLEELFFEVPEVSEQAVKHLLSAEVLPEKIGQITMVRQKDDIWHLLCANGGLSSLVKTTSALDTSIQQIQSGLCQLPSDNEFWEKLQRNVDLSHLLSQTEQKSEAVKYRKMGWSQIARDTKALSGQIQSELSDPDSLVSRAMIFARSVRLDPIWKSAKKFQEVGTGNISEKEFNTFVQQGLNALSGILESSLGPSDLFWRSFQDSIKQYTIMYRWTAATFRKFETENLTFGGLFETPVTVEKILELAPEYLPTFVDILTAAQSYNFTEQLSRNLSADQQKYALCVDPGLSGFLRFPPNTNREKVKEIQDAFCRMDTEAMTEQLRRSFEVDNVVHELTSSQNLSSRPSKKSDYTLATVYEAGQEMNIVIGKAMQRWVPLLDSVELDWDRIVQSLARQQQSQLTLGLTESQLTGGITKTELAGYPEALLKTLKNSDGLDPVSHFLYRFVKAMEIDLQQYMDMMSPNSSLYQLSTVQAYVPYLNTMIVETASDPIAVRNLVKVDSLEEAFCVPNNSYFATPTVPAPLDWSQFKRFICSTNWTQLAAKTQRAVSAPATTYAIQKIQSNDSGKRIDWEDFSRTVKNIDVLSRRSQDFAVPMASNNSVSNVDPNFEKAVKKLLGQIQNGSPEYFADLAAVALKLLGMSNAMEQNMNGHKSDATWYKELTDGLIPLNSMLADWNERMETSEGSGLTLQKLLPDSPALQELLREGLPLVDEMIDVARNTAIYPNKFIEATAKLTSDGGAIEDCQQLRLSDFLSMPQMTSAQMERLTQWICANADILQMELSKLQNSQGFQYESPPQSLGSKSLNWAQLADTISRTTKNMQKLNKQNLAVFPAVYGFNTRNIESAWADFTRSMERAESNAQRLNAIVLDAFAREIDGAANANPMTHTLWEGAKILTLYGTGAAKAVNRVFDRIQFLPSSEIRLEDLYDEGVLKKGVSLIRNIPESVEFLLSSTISYPEKYQDFIAAQTRNESSVAKLCLNRSLFDNYFPTPSGMERFADSAHRFLCSGDFRNPDSLIRQQLQVYPEIFLAADAVSSLAEGSQHYPLKINFTDAFAAMESASQKLHRSESVDPDLRFQAENAFSKKTWKKMWQRVQNRLLNADPHGFQGLLVALAPLFKEQNAFSSSVSYVSNRIEKRLKDESVRGNTLLDAKEELRRLVTWLEQYAISMTETVLYTWSESPEKLSELNSISSLDDLYGTLCSVLPNNVSAVFKSPPYKTVDIDSAIHQLCAINLTVAVSEAIDWMNGDATDKKVAEYADRFKVDLRVLHTFQSAAASLSRLSNTVANLTKTSNFLGSLRFDWLQEPEWKPVVDKYFDHVTQTERWDVPLESASRLLDSQVASPFDPSVMRNLILLANDMKMQLAFMTGNIHKAWSSGEITELQKLSPIAEHGLGIAQALLSPRSNTQGFIEFLSESGDPFGRFCGMRNFSRFFSPSIPQFNPEEIQDIICSINFDRLEQELVKLGETTPSYGQRKAPSEGSGKVEDLILVSKDIGELLEQVPSQELRIFGGTAEEWMNLADKTLQKGLPALTPSSPTKTAEYTGAVAAALMTESLPPSLVYGLEGILYAANRKLYQIDRGGDTVTVDKLFPDSPHTSQAIKELLPFTPHMFEILLWSSSGYGVSQQKINRLQAELAGTKSVEEAQRMLCGRYSSLSQYLHHLTMTETEWRRLQVPVCFTLDNWDRIQRELSAEVNFTRKTENAGKPNSRLLLESVTEFSGLLEKVSSRQVTLEGVPEKIQGSEYWENLFDSYQQNRTEMLTSTDQILVQLNSLDGAMKNVTIWTEFKTALGNVLHALSSQIATLANRGPQTVLQLRDLVPDSLPSLQNWLIESVRMSPTLVDSLTQAKLRDPWRFYRAIQDPEFWEKDVCRSVEGPAGLFQVSANSSHQLRDYFCGTDWMRVYEDFQRFLDLDVAKLEHALRRPMDPSSSRNGTQMSWERIMYTNDALTASLNKLIANDPAFQLPRGTAEQWGELIQRLMDTMSLTDLKELPISLGGLPETVDRLYPSFKNSSAWTAMYPYYSASENLVNFLNAYVPIGSGKLVSDPELLVKKLGVNVGLSPKAAEMVVSSVQHYPDTVTQLLSASDSDLRVLFCDRRQAQLMFHLLDLRYFISTDLCGKKARDVKKVVSQHLNMTNFVQKIGNPWPEINHFEFSRFYEAHVQFFEQIEKFAAESQYWDQESWEEFLLKLIENNGVETSELVNGLRRGELDRFGNLVNDVLPVLDSETVDDLKPALRTLGGLAAIASNGGSEQNEFFVPLQTLLPDNYNFSEFLTGTYDQVPLFIEAFSLAEINVAEIVKRQPSEWFRDFCWNGSISPLFRFPEQIDRNVLSQTVCNINYQPIVSELTRKIQSQKIPLEQLETLDSNDLMTDFIRLLQDSIAGLSNNIPSAPVSVSGARLLRNFNEMGRNTKGWPDLERRLGNLLNSADVVLAGSDSGDALKTYAKTISSMAESLRKTDKTEKDSVTLLRALLNDSAGFSDWVEKNLAIDRKTIERLLSSYVRSNQMRNVRNVCVNGKVRAGIFVAVNPSETEELGRMLCKLYFPVLLEQLHFHMKPNVPQVSELLPDSETDSAPVNWNTVMEDLSYLASNSDQLQNRLPQLNVDELLSIRGDLAVLLQDLSPYDSETDPNTAQHFLVKYAKSMIPAMGRESEKVTSNEVVSEGQAFTSVMGVINRKMMKSEGRNFSFGNVIGNNSARLVEVLRNQYGWNNQEISSLFQMEFSISTLQQLASPSGVGNFCAQSISSLSLRNRLCSANSSDLWRVIVQNFDVKQLTSLIRMGPFNWRNIYSGSGNIMKMLQGFSQPAPSDLQSLNSGQFSKALKGYLNSFGVAALKTFQNLPSIVDKAVDALEAVLAPMADVNLSFDAIMSREQLIEELFRRLGTAGLNVTNAVTVEEIGSLVNHSPSFRSLLYDAVCDLGRLKQQQQLCLEPSDSILPVCKLKQEIGASLQGLPSAELVAGKLCSSFVTDWLTAIVNQGVPESDASNILTAILSAYVRALKEVHSEFEVQTVHSDEENSVSPYDLNRRISKLQRTLNKMKGRRSWGAVFQQMFSTLPTMSEEARKSISNSIADISSIYHLPEDTMGIPLRILKDDVVSVSRSLQEFSGVEDEGWQEAVSQLSSVIGEIAEGSWAMDGSEENILSNLGNKKQLEQMIDACKRVAPSLSDGAGMKETAVYAQIMSRQLRSFSSYKNAMCRLSTMDTRELYETAMYDLDWANAVKEMQMLGRSKEKNCTEYASSLMELWQSLYHWSEQVQSPDGRQLGRCIKDADTSVFKSLDRYLELASGISRMVSEPELAAQVSRLQPKFRDFVGILEENVPVFAPLQKYLADSDTLDYQLSLFGVPKRARTAFLQSEADITYLERFNDVHQLETALCDPNRLRRLIVVSSNESGVDWDALSEELCDEKKAAVSGVIFAALDFNQIAQDLPGLKNERLLSLDWILQVAQRGSRLIEGGVLLNERSKALKRSYWMDISDPTEANRKQNEEEMNQLVAIAESLVNDAAIILGGSTMVDDFQKVLDGISGLKLIKNVLRQSEGSGHVNFELRKFLTTQLNYSDAEADTLINYGVDIGSLLKTAQTNHGKMCNSSSERRLDDYHHNITIVDDLIGRMCKLDPSLLKNITLKMSQLFDLSFFAKRYVRRAMERKLESAGMSQTDAREAVNEIRRLPDLLPLLTDGGSDDFYSSKLRDRTMALSAHSKEDEDSGANPAAYAGRMFCGKDVSEEFEKLRSSYLKPSGVPTQPYVITVKDRREMNQLPSAYCRQMYRSLVSSQGGQILWSYIKPLIRGEVSVVPDTLPVRNIIREANKTFVEISSWLELIQSSSKANAMFSDMQNSEDELRKLQAALGHPFVRGALKQALDLDASQLVVSLNSASKLPQEDAEKLEQLAALVKNISSCISLDRFKFYKDENHWKESMQFVGQNDNILAAIVFDSFDSKARFKRSVPARLLNVLGLPKHIHYRIRMDINAVPRTDLLIKSLTDQLPDIPFVSSSPYLYGFVQLQDMIDNAIVRLQALPSSSLASGTAVYTQKLPLPCREKDVSTHADYEGTVLYKSITYCGSSFRFVSHLKFWLPLFMIAAWMLSVGVLVSSFVRDFDTGIAQVLSVMGLRRSVRFFGWFLTSSGVLFLVGTLVTLILKFGGILPLTNWILIALLMMDFSIALIMLSYLISSFFKKTTLAALTGVIIYLMSFLPFLIINMTDGWKISFSLRVLSCFSAPAAFSFACTYMASWEQAGYGLQWSNVDASVWHGDKFNFTIPFLMLILDSSIYALIAYAVSRARTKRWSNLRGATCWPWLCFCSGRISSSLSTTSSFDFDAESSSESSVVSVTTSVSEETTETEENVVVSLRHLTKTFGDKHAVVNMNLNMYNGQITALLGQNGAGKTTTINMLTGITPPTAGIALVNGNDITKSRNILGLCPQENILFHRLTIQEHLEFYGKLKGTLNQSELKRDVQKLLDQTRLRPVKDVQVCHLSGGMRRRLCVALAFVGGSEVVILDEPTAGVDPVARRAIWDIITENKTNRVILLCTHYLDEADLLSDRIAIVHQGRLLCCGSSGFLKERFGSGYHMTISRNTGCLNSSYPAETLENYIQSSTRVLPSPTTRDAIKRLKDFICRFVPSAELIDQTGTEMTFALPSSKKGSAMRVDLSELFSHMDENLQHLGVQNYGVSDTTLEEVFLTVCFLADNRMDLNKTVDERVTALKSAKTSVLHVPVGSDLDKASFQEDRCSMDNNDKSILAAEEAGRMLGSSLKLQQMKALLIKRFHHTRRDWRVLLSGVLLPCLFVFMAMGLSLLRPEQNNAGRRVLTPEIYGPGMSMFFATEDYEAAILEKGLFTSTGIGVHCLKDADPQLQQDHKCRPADEFFVSDYLPGDEQSEFTGRLKQCSCENGGQICPLGAEGVISPRRLTNSSDLLYDCSEAENGFGISSYLLRTYRKNEDKRFGGWSFGTDPERPEKSTIKVWFDETAVHGIPAFLSGASNIQLRAAVKRTPEQFGISTYSHPFKFGKSGKIATETLEQRIADVGIGLVLLCAYSFIPAAAVIYVVQERINKERHLQALCGVGPVLYWSVSFIWDILLYAFATLLGAIIMAVFQLPIYTANLNLLATVVLIFCYGMSSLPLMYLFQRIFNDGTISYLILFCLSIFVGINTMVTSILLNLFHWNPAFEKAYGVVKFIFLFFPQYCFTGGLVELARNHIRSTVLDSGYPENSVYQNPFSFHVIGLHCVALLFQGVVYFLLSVLLDFKQSWTTKKSGMVREDPVEDSDVSAEAIRVLNSAETDSLRVLNLRKVYRSGLGKTVAVKNLSLGVQQGECFGLLGVNGAGKTTTFKMLSGDLSPSSGAAYLFGKSLTRSKFRKDQDLGYCPQEDACDPLLTSRELLAFYGRLRGYPEPQVTHLANLWLSRLELLPYADRIARVYSGGTKRKLCVACALLGKPRMILMDEPTSGMDPATRRMVWGNLNSVLADGRSILLTSHSMEECDAVCGRLAIMVNGKLNCIGSPQHLKQRFGDGYTVSVRVMHHEDLSGLYSFVQERFPFVSVREEHFCSSELLFPSHTVPLPKIFTFFDSNKNQMKIRDYSVSQATLDQVFVSFAKQQTDGVEDLSSESAAYSNPLLTLSREHLQNQDDKGRCRNLTPVALQRQGSVQL